jgi:hypothetical protein
MPEPTTPTAPEPVRPVVAKQPASAPATTGSTLFVACKHPPGLELTYWDEVDDFEATPSGVRQVKVYRRNAERSFRVDGPNTVVDPHLPGPQLLRFRESNGGYAVTPGCPREVWDHWSRINYLMIDARIVNGFDTMEGALRWCREQRDVRSGLEPIDPANTQLTTGIRQIEPGTPTAG